MASVLRERLPAEVAGGREVLLRVDRAVLIGERELRYQLQHKDNHPLAEADELLDVLAELEARGLIDVERCFRLTAEGRGRLAELDDLDGEG